MISTIFEWMMIFFGGVIFVYMLIVILSYSMMLCLAFFHLKREYRLDKKTQEEVDIVSEYSMPVSIIVPAYNEEVGIIDSIYSLLSLRYAEVELVVVNDGSKDGTQQKVLEHFRMVHIPKVIQKQIETKSILNVFQSTIHPNLWLIEKENGEKQMH